MPVCFPYKHDIPRLSSSGILTSTQTSTVLHHIHLRSITVGGFEGQSAEFVGGVNQVLGPSYLGTVTSSYEPVVAMMVVVLGGLNPLGNAVDAFMQELRSLS